MFYTTIWLISLASCQLISGQDRFFPLMAFADQAAQQLSEELICEETLQFDPRLWDCQEVQQVDLSQFECWEETDFDQQFDCNEDLSETLECTEQGARGSTTINPSTPTGSGATITTVNNTPTSGTGSGTGTISQQSPSASGSGTPSSAQQHQKQLVSMLMALAMVL